MNFATKAKALLLGTLLLGAGLVGAEDIDIYQGDVVAEGNLPNVLIILDNSANWSRNNQHWPEGKQGDAELIALGRVLEGLSNVRVGLMMMTTGGGSEKDGGYMRFGVREMTPANRSKLQEIISGIRQDGVNSTQQKVSQANYSNAMYEAYRYFSGLERYAALDDNTDYTGNGAYNIAPYKAGNIDGNALANTLSSTKYSPPLSTASLCAPNFVIFIGNGFPSTDGDATTQTGAGLENFNATQIYASSKDNWADEWARYLKQYGAIAPCESDDPAAACADGKITTYTIDVYKEQQDLDQTKLFRSMATVGGGEYYAATSLEELEVALNDIFNQIQAVNSVFASSSLPVSVNTQGTYLNQIYMGVFRPDETKNPRWLGNLKQYKFAIQTNDEGDREIFLADADGKAAVNPLTGFIKTDVRSFWSSTVDVDSGFWAFRPTGIGEDQDSPDGDLVEKGAAAQKLRSLGPTSREVYTCAPNCTVDATPTAFHTDNTSLVTSLTGTESAVSMVRVGTTVTATTATDLALLSPTDTVTIAGANVSSYNGTWPVTTGANKTFTFSVAETPATPATGTITVSSGASVSQSGASMSISNGKVTVNLAAHGFISNQLVTISGADVSASMSTADVKCQGYPSTANCEYNGTFAVTVVDANNFTYTPPVANFGATQTSTTALDPPATIAAPGSTTFTCKNTAGTISVNNASVVREAGGAGTSVRVRVRLDSTPTGCTTPLKDSGGGSIQSVVLAGTGSDVLDNSISIASISSGSACGGSGTAEEIKLDYCFNVTVVETTEVTATNTIIPSSPATGTIRVTGIPTRAVQSITRTAGDDRNIATVTVTTTAAHGFDGTDVQINGADQAEYNGTKTGVTYPDTDQIRFTLTTGPTAAASGTASKGTDAPAATLINWVRGVDNKEDENVDGSFTDVRASIHGDVLHSRPLLINYGNDANGKPIIVAYYGTNGGTFHAVKVGDNEEAGSVDGIEKWSFVAPEHYSRLGRLYNNSPKIYYPDLANAADASRRDYFFDGNIGAYQSIDPHVDQTHIFISMRRGGRVIYALDVSNPDAPKYLWKRSNADATVDEPEWAEMGQTWSEPKFIPIKAAADTACNLQDDTTFVRGLVFGGGYDPTVEDSTAGTARAPGTGRGVFVLNAANGNLIKLLQAPAANGTRYSFAAELTLIDSDNDGCVDRLYGADTGANIYRFDIGDPVPDNWSTYRLAKLGDTGADGGSDDRKFLYRPDAVFVDTYDADNVRTRTTYLMVGSGNRENPRSTAVQDAFFMIKDGVVTGTDPATVTAVQIGDVAFKEISFADGAVALTKEGVMGPEVTGWYLYFDSGEKTVNAALTLAGITYFGTNLPKEATAQCTPNLGTARGYAINFVTGTPAYDRDGEEGMGRADLYGNVVGGGLPPSPVSGTVCIGNECPRFCIGCCVGPDCASIEGSKITATPDPRRQRIYWYFKKDQ